MSRATHFVGTADLPQKADPPGRWSALPRRAISGLPANVLLIATGTDQKEVRDQMRVDQVEIFSDATNAAVMRHPDRRFPGLLVQGDTLSTLYQSADLICQE